jgi:uncharacterized membrane protein YdfJ with MMPL/SSD domain
MNVRLRRLLRLVVTGCAAHPRMVIAAWLVATLAGFLALPVLQARLDEAGFLVDGSESAQVRTLVEREFPAAGASVQVALPPGPATVGAARDVAARLRHEPGVRSVEVVARGSTEKPAVLGLIPQAASNEATDLVPGWRDAASEAAGDTPVHVGGAPAYYADVNRLTREDLASAERIGLPLTFLVLIVAFGSLAAAAVSLAVSAAGLAMAFALFLALSQVFSLQVFVLNLAALVGFGVGVDYALLMVSRIRYELVERGDADALDSIAIAGEQAGHAIVISGSAVLLALSGLFAIGISSFDGMALGTMIAVAAMVLAALTLLPAVAAFTHRRLHGRASRRPARQNRNPLTDRFLRTIIRHPVAVGLSSTTLLLAVSLPALGIEFRMFGISTLPPNTDSRQAAGVVDAALGPGGSSPILLTVPEPGSDTGERTTRRVVSLARANPAVRGVESYRSDPAQHSARGGLGLVEVQVMSEPEDAAAQDTVAQLRDAAGNGALVGGQPAERFDEVARYKNRLPFAVAAVLLATAAMLLLAFRSVLVPVKAVVATLLSAGAALGAVTWVFQEGHLADLFGFQQIDGVPAFLPIFLFPIIFGLSMDYEVFLLSRIAEERNNGVPDRAAIVAGLTKTATTITGAAAVMVSVALAFAGTDLLPTQATGFGIIVAVLLDATVVRLALVPATLVLLGPAAWWWPRRNRPGQISG